MYPIKEAKHIEQLIEMDIPRFWTPDDFTGISRKSILRKLASLADAKTLTRIRRGLYWCSEDGNLPSKLTIFQKICGYPGVGYSGHSAIDYLLTGTVDEDGYQEIAIPTRPPRDIIDLNCRLHNRASRRKRLEESLNQFEVSVLECFQRPELILSKSFPSVIEALIEKSEISIHKLVSACDTEPALVRVGFQNLLIKLSETESAKRIKPAYFKPAEENAWK